MMPHMWQETEANKVYPYHSDQNIESAHSSRSRDVEPHLAAKISAQEEELYLNGPNINPLNGVQITSEDLAYSQRRAPQEKQGEYLPFKEMVFVGHDKCLTPSSTNKQKSKLNALFNSGSGARKQNIAVNLASPQVAPDI